MVFIMSRNKKSGRKYSKSVGDVTINDFANSTVCKNRLKKSCNNVTQVLKETLDDDKTWEEKQDEEGDLVQQENEDGTVCYVVQKPTKTHNKTDSICAVKPEDNGNVYPIDIWYLISEYIRPEDVGRFAGICRASFEVVNGARFWFSMYRRYYKSASNLPEKLRPEYLQRKYSLRTSVIRALHYMYMPFKERLKSLTTFAEHPDVLKKRQCVLMWHTKKNVYWVYYFKMKAKSLNLPASYRKSESSYQADLLEILDDVCANPDDQCQLLKVTCKHFISVPPVMGLTLTSVSMDLSHGFRHHRLQLVFGTGVPIMRAGIDDSYSTIVVLDPVLSVKVLNWWHPLYPYNYAINLNVLDED